MTAAFFVAFFVANLALTLLVLRNQRILARRIAHLLKRPTVHHELKTLGDSVATFQKQAAEQLAGVDKVRKLVKGQTALIEHHHDDAIRQMNSRIALSDLNLRFPLFLGDWAVDGVLARELVNRIEKCRPSAILELGSGASSVVIAATLRQLGLDQTRHIVVDHLSEFLDTTKRNLEVQGLGQRTEFWHCPLTPTLDGIPWYAGLQERLGLSKLDLVLVDGPPAADHPRAREPALLILGQNIREGGMLMLDDTNRERETAIVERWKLAQPNFRVKVSARGKGLVTFEREA